MLNVSPKTRVAIITSSLVLFGTLAAAAGLLYMIDRATTRLATTENELVRLTEEERAYSDLAMLAERTTVERAELEGYILKQDDVVGFLSLLERTGTERGVAVETKSIKTEPPVGGGAFETVVVSSELTGSMASLRSLIDLYEQLPYQLSIERFSLDRMGDENNEWRSSIDLRVTKALP